MSVKTPKTTAMKILPTSTVTSRRALLNGVPNKRQQGLSFISLLMWAFVFGIVGLFALRAVPIYTEYFGVLESLKSLSSSPGVGSQPSSAIRRDLQKKFDVNDITSISARDVKIAQGESGKQVTAKYEVRTPLFWDFDLVAKLDKTVTLRP